MLYSVNHGCPLSCTVSEFHPHVRFVPPPSPLLKGVLKPDNVVVFYPTRYDVDMVASSVACPVAAFFAEHDALPGATVEDARSLLDGLLINEKVRFCYSA